MSEKSKALLSQRAARAMNKPGFPESIIDSPVKQQEFVTAVSKAENISALPWKYQRAIRRGEKGINSRLVDNKLRK